MKEVIIIKPVEMTEELMQKLENLSIIERIIPSNTKHREKREKLNEKFIYHSSVEYGAHSLVFCSIDRNDF